MNQDFNKQFTNQYNNAMSNGLQNYARISKAYTWPVIITVLILFWPVGIFLMYKRINSDKAAILKNSKTVEMISYVLMALSVIYIIMGLTGNLEAAQGGSVAGQVMMTTLMFGGGGIYLLFVSRKMKKVGERYKRYIDLIVNQSQYSIDNIAATVGIPYEAAKKDLLKMIQAGYFVGGYINEANREIIIQHQQNQTSADGTQLLQTKVAACKSCGANNTAIVGKVSACEYCGSPIN